MSFKNFSNCKINVLIAFVITLLVSVPDAMARRKTEERELIKKIAGCFAVEADFIEKQALSEGYTLKPAVHQSWKELIVLSQFTKSKVSLESVVIETQSFKKGWATSWEYEPNWTVQYLGENKFEFKEIKTKNNEWIQRNYFAEFKPMSSCVAPFSENKENTNDSNDDELTNINQIFWQCQADSALPHRENQRTDYNLMNTDSKLVFFQDGWRNIQLNKKIQLQNGNEIPLVIEETVLKYKRISDSECADAATWWTEKKSAWNQVLLAWNDITKGCVHMQFTDKIEGKTLNQRLTKLVQEASQSEIASPSFKAHAFEIITNYMLSCEPKAP